MSMISISDLVKRYDKLTALKGITFDVKHGEVFALLGPNGSGKTTTLEILMGLRSFDAGDIRFFDKNGHQVAGFDVGPVFQTPVYYESLTVAELIHFYSKFYRTSAASIQQYLSIVDLSAKMDTEYKNLSGGQKQQVAIVLSLLNDPPILFFDEPSNALDPQIRQKIWQIIRALKDMGKTVIFTTHYIEEAEALADRVAIMSKGQIIVTDTPQNIIQHYNESFNVEFELEHDVDVSAFGELGVCYRDGVYSFSVDAINGRVLQVIKDISEQFSLSKVSIGKSSLEDVFVRLTGEKALP
jgi:ABC-2 type transport system ATP-binding protein